MNTILPNHGDAVDCPPAVAIAILQGCPLLFPTELELPPITFEMACTEVDLTSARAYQENVYGAIHTVLYCDGLIAAHRAAVKDNADDNASTVFYTTHAWPEHYEEFTLDCKVRAGVKDGKPWFFRTATCDGLTFDGSQAFDDDSLSLIWQLAR